VSDGTVSSFANSRAGAIGTLLFSRSDVERLLTPDACKSLPACAHDRGGNDRFRFERHRPDVAAAAAVYSRAVERGERTSFSFNA